MAIRALRTDRQMTQEALGMKAGIHPTWVSQIEGGRVNPRLSNLALLSEALEVKLSQLIAFAEELDLKIQSMSPAKGGSQ
jgi:transcriptional regulator with XRE-family HTH domain